ncbi:hypothetical protein MKX03_014927 [Papaver bracteatum]|nr:hypothetical protein MKX03_014927 [Papaver bracteatum]
MKNSYWVVAVVLLGVSCCFIQAVDSSPGDSDPLYKTCVEQCNNTGCVGENCFQHRRFSSDGASADGKWYMQEPLYLRWKQWDCQKRKRENLGKAPVKYHGKWPFKRVFGIQEPVSVAFSAFNLAMQFHGWLSFFLLLCYKLPLRPETRKPYYEFSCLWHIYGLLAMNSWFWSAVFTVDVDLTEKIDYSSAVALLGFSLILAFLRTFNVRHEASRVMISAPLLAFITTHILYLNFYQLDYVSSYSMVIGSPLLSGLYLITPGLCWNMKVCVVMGVTQLLLWAVWAGVTRGLAMRLKIYDFPPYMGFIDAHALWHLTTIPLAYLWWSFIKNDAEFRTSELVKKVK